MRDYRLWTDEEDNIVKENYRTKGVEFCHALVNEITPRSVAAIQHRAHRLGVAQPRPWARRAIKVEEPEPANLNYCQPKIIHLRGVKE